MARENREERIGIRNALVGREKGGEREMTLEP